MTAGYVVQHEGKKDIQGESLRGKQLSGSVVLDEERSFCYFAHGSLTERIPLSSGVSLAFGESWAAREDISCWGVSKDGSCGSGRETEL